MSKQNRRLTSSTSSSNGNITPKTSSTSRLNISNDFSAGRSYLDTDDDISLSDEELPLKKKRKKRIIEDDESDDELQSVVVHISDDDFSDTDTTIQNKPVALKHGADGKLCHECDYKDICDCLFTNCQGCFPSCPMCRANAVRYAARIEVI
ncbi:unnamed protein product [Auanema sp. JU1783]|nr:unnamed protein product [Auanema sp. JU1783]